MNTKTKPTLAEAVAKIQSPIENELKKQKENSDDKVTKQLLVRLSSAAHKQLKYLSIEEERDMQSLMIEALNNLFIKYKKQPIA